MRVGRLVELGGRLLSYCAVRFVLAVGLSVIEV